MDAVILKNTLIDLRGKATIYQEAAELRILEKCPFIVEVGALTVTTDESGQVLIQNTPHPSQFSEESVKEILGISFKNGNDEAVIPKVYGRSEWYMKRLQEVNDAIRTLELLTVA